MPEVDTSPFVIMICLPLFMTWVVWRFFRGRRRRRRRKRKARNPQPQAKTTWGRLIAGNLLVLLMLLSYLTLAGEIYFRYWYEQTDSFGLTLTTNRWFLKHYQLNKSGWRDNVAYAPKRSSKRRISFVGDSFTVGHGIKEVEDRFANIVRRKNPDWEIQVLASNGWDTKQELELIDNVQKWKSDLDVVVLIYCLNDISDVVPQWQEILDKIYADTEPGYLGKNSYLFNTLHYRWIAASNSKVGNYFQFTREAYAGPIWDVQAKRLTDLHERIQKQNAQLVVVTFPFVHALGDEYPFTAAHQRLNDFWQRRGVAHLDLTSFYEGRQGSSLVVNSLDAHPNEEAHAIAADAMTTFLRGVVKKSSEK